MTTLADHLDEFLTDLARRARPNTCAAYRSDLTLASQQVPVPLEQITLPLLEDWLESGGVAAATVARRAASLKRFFTWACRHDLCVVNPLVQREPRRAIQRLPRPVRSTTDLTALDAAIATAPQPYRLLFTVLRETGMRIGEVLALNIGDVVLDPGRESLRVREPKNGSERVTILGPDATPKSLRGLRAWVRSLKGQPAHAPLFRSNRGTRVSYAATQYQWAQLCHEAGLIEVEGTLRYTLHQLRHTRGSELIRQGQRIEIVQRVLGHRDIRSTQGYAALDDVQVREALERGGQH